MTRKSFSESANQYIALGWAVHPVHPIRDGRCACGKECGKSAGKHPCTPHGFKDASKDPEQIEAWVRQLGEDSNIAVATEVSGLLVYDVDLDKGGRESFDALAAEHGQLPKTPTQRTGGGGLQYFFRRPEGGAPSSVGFRPGLDGRCDGAYVCVPSSLHRSGGVYAWEPGLSPFEVELADPPAWLVDAIRAGKVKDRSSATSATGTHGISEGSRNATLASMAGASFRKGKLKGEVLEELEKANQSQCVPPLAKWEVASIVNSIERYHLAPTLILPVKEPPKLADAALYGLAGKIVRAIEPHTEASMPALLVQLLSGFGNLVGRTAHTLVEADFHPTILNVVVVGSSSKARKGTSWGHIARVLEKVDPDWSKDRQASGLSSGEGLIWAVRDAIHETKRIKDGETEIEEYREVMVDPGVGDKRLQIVEGELVSALKVSSREGNTLSAVVRNAWDGKNLASLTKNSNAKATRPHISIIGHITTTELRRFLTNTEIANGFGNRFLFVYSMRSKELPDGGQIASVDFSGLVNELKAAKEFAQHVGQIQRDPEATALWRLKYSELSADRPGLYGSLVTRAETQVLRLSGIFAILEKSHFVRKVHLEAALAVWNYCEDSVRFIFGDALGDPVADEILAALRGASKGLSRTNIRDLFKRNKSADEVGRSLQALSLQGLAHAKIVESAGRPSEVWLAGKSQEGNDRNDINDQSPRAC